MAYGCETRDTKTIVIERVKISEQFACADFFSLISTPITIRWTIPLSFAAAFIRDSSLRIFAMIRYQLLFSIFNCIKIFRQNKSHVQFNFELYVSLMPQQSCIPFENP
jgi:hypothetical protein